MSSKRINYSKLSREDRIQSLVQLGYLNADQAQSLINNQGLSAQLADQMIENAVGSYGLPLGFVPQLIVNHQDYLIPMATEEASVIAAASFGSQIINRNGGCQAEVTQSLLTGQIAFYGFDPQDEDRLTEFVNQDQDRLLALANQVKPSLLARGGGARHIYTTFKGEASQGTRFFILYLDLDSQEAMGANTMNTILEVLKDELVARFQDQINPEIQALMAILSNYSPQSLVTASCQIKGRQLKGGGLKGGQVAQRIALASQLAQVDRYRATTHNKGIMNGIDALVLATGNDWRAVEAGIHAYASQDGHYRGLAQWSYDGEADLLTGQITLPLTLGTVGGSIANHPQAQINLDLLGRPTSQELMMVVAGLALAQNLAALRALVAEGIQAGHMSLQYRNLALQVGAQDQEVAELAQALKDSQIPVSQDLARQILADMRAKQEDKS
ncbi:hypothetical protein AWM75_03010 [Aerococcus urinaehominis]|uniref:3-hydroxy-3-methylglutaryl coenzyme A reductase n=1 Tax=Aerococcus urinaehominis TaxID=128944 RepID=A0A0X8FKK5_9LACT|nr:hydroxymethylglutaryl-CoA reductase, degradative [Aerococcus urinaehominis]AMB99030.1 hypothetical protein AWM75_03010 [Aerococcus urinaehominis]SDM51140.1 3-hydroxy-3-methylglutaryl-coenzyme A reductase [Aerococcus urinaehominis]